MVAFLLVPVSSAWLCCACFGRAVRGVSLGAHRNTSDHKARIKSSKKTLIPLKVGVGGISKQLR